MTSVKKALLIFPVLALAAALSACSQNREAAGILLRAEAEGRPVPLLSARYSDMDLAMAYGVQKAYVQKKLAAEKTAGFKAGLTSRGGQKRFGVDAPVAGVLFESGKLTGRASVDPKAFKRLMMETEIGFFVAAPLKKPVSDAGALRAFIREAAPVIELPDLGFADLKTLKGTDIIAGNAAARQFIVGAPRSVDDFDLNAVTVSLTRDGREINRGKGSEASGDQWRALLWLVNTMIGQGWELEPGHILLTGALGKMLPGKPGKHVADYGDFGKIAFEIQP
ncbi:2-hydroxypenta-2,4-dienoate hydratase [Candidatus Desulfarcum epimagneticum]|uniref:2-hydroxypenta-2,4-dienoate hydratase n=1 Tax=uncultured Desulfobacteraceae bacterium TaxID=218296 RepID=A0A484HDB4_9BACT|nr:2-hydroxypenta-2,4-dienoate hydratase [uncultured Desulfobacteraceae bacterium]